jgi:predicted transcriptional regulator
MFGPLISKYVKRHMHQHLEPVREGFTHVAKDIARLDSYAKESRDLLQKWNAYFLATIQKLEKSAKNEPKLDISKELDHLHKAHSALYAHMQQTTKTVSDVASDLHGFKSQVSAVVHTYNKHLSAIHGELARLKEQKQVKIDENEPFLTSSKAKSEPSTLKDLTVGLTTAERELLFIFIESSQKLTYKDLSVNYGRSPSTIKNMVLRLKSKGLPLIEVADADGVKRYYLEDHMKKLLLSKKV